MHTCDLASLLRSPTVFRTSRIQFNQKSFQRNVAKTKESATIPFGRGWHNKILLSWREKFLEKLILSFGNLQFECTKASLISLNSGEIHFQNESAWFVQFYLHFVGFSNPKNLYSNV